MNWEQEKSLERNQDLCVWVGGWGEGLFWGRVGILVPGGYSVTEMLLRDPSCGCSLGQPIPGRAKKGCLRPSACRAPAWVFPPPLALWAGERLFSINNNDL